MNRPQDARRDGDADLPPEVPREEEVPPHAADDHGHQAPPPQQEEPQPAANQQVPEYIPVDLRDIFARLTVNEQAAMRAVFQPNNADREENADDPQDGDQFDDGYYDMYGHDPGDYEPPNRHGGIGQGPRRGPGQQGGRGQHGGRRGGPIGHQFQQARPAFISGFRSRPAPRNAAEQARALIALPRDDRGTTVADRIKTRRLVVQALQPKMDSNSISRILTAEDASSFDFAEETMRWEQATAAVREHAHRFDLMSLLMIPRDIGIVNDEIIFAQPPTRFYDITLEWREVELDEVKWWQKYVLENGDQTELENNDLLNATLVKSMTEQLRAEVWNDEQSIPITMRGAAMTFFLAVRRMVLRNQEEEDALVEYTRSFDIRAVPNQNVELACLKLEAVGRTLGSKLPSNAIKCILRGFAEASNEEFKALCNYELTWLDRSENARAVAALGYQAHLSKVLKDISSKFLTLMAARKWNGIGHDASAFLAEQRGLVPTTSTRSATPTSALGLVNLLNGCDTFEAAHVVASTQGHSLTREEWDVFAARGPPRDRQRLPREEWLKTQNCHNCNERGHLAADCPKPPRRDRDDRRRGSGPSRRFNKLNKKGKARVLNAMMDLYGGDDEDDVDDQDSHGSNEDDNDNEGEVEESAFFSQVNDALGGQLKW